MLRRRCEAARSDRRAVVATTHAGAVSTKDWWRRCIVRSFEIARDDEGHDPDTPALDAGQQERVFQRIYSLFGSHVTYGVFPDVVPFLTWARRKGIVTGIISNADERYGDAILPMLDLSDHLDFNVFARDVHASRPGGNSPTPRPRRGSSAES